MIVTRGPGLRKSLGRCEMKFKLYVLLVTTLMVCAVVFSEEGETSESFLSELDYEVHGFYEVRAGYRTRKDSYEKDM